MIGVLDMLNSFAVGCIYQVAGYVAIFICGRDIAGLAGYVGLIERANSAHLTGETI